MTNRSNINLIDNITSAENLGNGIGVFKEKNTSNNLQFKSLSAGTNVILTNSGDTITISSINGSMLNGVNGLNRTNTDIGLGGIITGNTEIELSGNTLDISNLVPFNIGSGFNSGSIDAIAIQPDGKILIGGSFTSYSGNSYNNIVRLYSDGSIDETFVIGSGFGGSSYTIYSIIVLSDEKILIGGTFISYSGVSRQNIIRLNSNGSVDNSFDTSVGFNSTVRSIAVQSDGKILVGGIFTLFGANIRQRIARLNSNGTLDTTFNTSIGFNSTAYSIAIQSDGKILVGGSFSNFSGVTRQRIARLNSNGTLDTAYGGILGFNGNVFSIALQSDGKLLVGGYFTTYSGITRQRIARLNSNGTLDTTFGTSTGFDDGVYNISLQSDGKILVGGDFYSYASTIRRKITRLNSNGSDDSTFINTDGGFNNTLYSLIIQSDGKIWAGGLFTTYRGVSYNRIVKLNNSGYTDGGIYHDIIYDGKVVNYGNNYREYFTDHTLIDKQYVDDKFSSAATVDNGLTKTCNNIQLGGSLIQSTNIIGSFPLTMKVSTLNLSGGTSISLNSATISISGNTANFYSQNNLNIKGSTISMSGNTALLSTPSTGTISDRLLMWNTSDKCIKSYDSGNVLWRAITGVTSLGSGNGMLCGAASGHNLCIKSLSAGTNITLSCNNNYVLINAENDRTTATNGLTKEMFDIQLGGSLNYNTTVDLNYNCFNICNDTRFLSNSAFNCTTLTVLMQPDGNMVVGGAFTEYSGISKGYALRFKYNGDVDYTFGRTGLTNGFNCSVNSSILQPDGKIVFGGCYTSYSGQSYNGLIRLNSNGSIDNSFVVGCAFGTGCIGGFKTGPRNMVLQSDCKILIIGNFNNYCTATRSGIVRLCTDGSVDNSYNTAYFNNVAYGIDFDEKDGGELIGGLFTSYSGFTACNLIKLRDNGYPDTSFTTGTFTKTGIESTVLAIKQTRDYKYLIGGRFDTYSGQSRCNIMRIHHNGFLDSSFKVGTGAGSSYCGCAIIRSIIEQTDGKLVIAGNFTSYSGESRYGIVRVCDNGKIDHTFGGIGSTAGFNCAVYTLDAHPKGGFIVGGDFTTYSGITAERLIRLDENGKIIPNVNSNVIWNGRVVEYGDNYETYYTNRSLVDKEYVDKKSNQIPQELTQSGAILTWDVSDGFNARITLTANITTFNFIGAVAGNSGVLTAIQNGTGGWTLALPVGHLKEGGALVLSTAAGAKDILGWYYDGTNYFWNIGKAFA